MILGHGLRAPAGIVDVDVDQPTDLRVADDVASLLVLFRHGRRPVGSLTIRGSGRFVRASVLQSVADQRTRAVRHVGSQVSRFTLPEVPQPSVTVAVCTRDRAAQLDRCLGSLHALDRAGLDVELLVVDNAPGDDRTERIVSTHHGVRYVREARPGLDWARNRALLEATGDVVAFTDDDVEVEPGWARALAAVFAADETVDCVTGLVLPAALDSQAAVLFESYGGFGRGYRRKWYRADRATGESVLATNPGPGEMGTGANMAVRRSSIERIGLFDPALDVGTVTGGGGDLEYFVRVLSSGSTLVYEPAAVVRHHHRCSLDALERQMHGHGHGFAAVLNRIWVAEPDERRAIAGLLRWYGQWFAKRTVRSLRRSAGFPFPLVRAEMAGFARGWASYERAADRARSIEVYHGVLHPAWPVERLLAAPPPGDRSPRPRPAGAVPIAELDLNEPLSTVKVDGAREVLLRVRRRSTHLAEVTVRAAGASLSPMRIADELSHRFAELKPAMVGHRAVVGASTDWPRSVSVLIATRDRPIHLAHCLERLAETRTSRRLQTIVVDNDPGSGANRAVLDRHPWVEAVEEPTPGLSNARNAGMALVTGQVVVTLDDDVEVDPDWLDQLLRPFADPRVDAVTANVQAASLDTPASRLFEVYGGLGRGDHARLYDRSWLHHRGTAPTWEIGATACAAFSTEALRDPAVGAWEPALGAGTPAGVGEDTLVFHRLLEQDRAIAYHPAAAVRHHHRADRDALRRQLKAYSAGHVAFLLTTVVDDRDLRGLRRITIDLPRYHARRLLGSATGRGSWPASLTVVEAAGNAVGPVAFWRSRRAARRRGSAS